MEENTLLTLSKSYLLTEAGKKLIDKGLDILSLKSQSQNQLKSVADLTSSEGISSKSNATREERKKVRQEKKQVPKDQIQTQKEQANQYTPELKQFNIKGRIYDKKESIPLQGVKVEVVIEDPVYLKLSEPGYSTSTLEDGTFEINIKLPFLNFKKRLNLVISANGGHFENK